MSMPEKEPPPPPVTSTMVILCSCPADRAERIASALVEKRLAACVNVTSAVTSIYRWQGEVEREVERLLIIKSRRDRWAELKEELAAMHPYEVPEIIALPVEAGEERYLQWVEENT